MMQRFLSVTFLATALLSSGVSSVSEPAKEDERTNLCLNLIETHCSGDANSATMETCVNSGLLSCARPSFCTQSAEMGMCRAAIPRFFFNSETGGCEEFTYGGCGGNENNFSSQEDCENACGGLRYCSGSTGAECPGSMECSDNLCVPPAKGKGGKPVTKTVTKTP